MCSDIATAVSDTLDVRFKINWAGGFTPAKQRHIAPRADTEPPYVTYAAVPSQQPSGSALNAASQELNVKSSRHRVTILRTARQYELDCTVLYARVPQCCRW